MLKHWQVTIEVHHLPGLALKANVPIDRSQARRKHRKLHLGHLVSFPETSRPTQLLGSSPFLATSRYTRATSGCQRLSLTASLQSARYSPEQWTVPSVPGFAT